MALEDQRLDYLCKQVNAQGLFCKRKVDGDSDSYRFSVSHDPEIELTLSKELLETSGWLFTQRADEALCTLTDAIREGRWGTLTMRFLDVVWHPTVDSQ